MLTYPELKEEVSNLVETPGNRQLIAFFLVFNFLWYFTRPQDIGFLSFLGALRVPLLVQLVPLFIWLGSVSRGWTKQTKLMGAFLLFECARGLLGKTIFDSMVRNDSFSFYIWRDFFFQCTTLVFPLVVFFDHGNLIRKFVKAWIFVTLYLSIFVATHHGVGPGGFMADENDAGLALLFFLPIPLVFLTQAKISIGKKFRYLCLVGLCIAAIVRTMSRGAFVGLVSVLLYFFLRSKRKLLLLFSGLVFVAVAIPLLPDTYIEEVRSIKDTQSGTADIRRHYWNLATRVWLDPRHILFGVGFNNVSFHMGDYETAADLEKFPSSAGRAVHSIYFQLLPDLGLWGVFVVGSLLWRSFRANSRLCREFKTVEKQLVSTDASVKRDSEDEEEINWTLQQEIAFLTPLLLALNVSFVAIFTAGAFISVLYYPLFWLLVGFSALLERYSLKVLYCANSLREMEDVELGRATNATIP